MLTEQEKKNLKEWMPLYYTPERQKELLSTLCLESIYPMVYLQHELDEIHKKTWEYRPEIGMGWPKGKALPCEKKRGRKRSRKIVLSRDVVLAMTNK